MRLVAAVAEVGLVRRFLAFMPLNEQDWRPITFQGVTFPATLMGISILEPVLGITDKDFGDWLWQLPICRGVTKSAPAERCARCARQAADLLLEQRQRVLDGIRDRLTPHGFDAESTYRDWIVALQRIAELSRAASGDCSWSAPSHPKDMKPADWRRLDTALEQSRAKFLETGEHDVRDGSHDTGNA